MSAPRPAGLAPDEQTAVRREILVPEPAEALAGLLDAAPPDDVLPPLWHWVYLLERPRHDDLGDDGHPRHGIPAPPGAGFKRMFAGGRVTTLAPLRLGEPATRATRVIATTEKTGRSGPLRFVTVRDTISQDDEPRVVEERDIVYRAAESTLPQSADPRGHDGAPGGEDPRRPDATLALDIDPALLFRFSALTYNAHRIHYDRDYARSEGYPDLVVHGPLQAMLMAELFRRHGASLVGREFAYRLVAPAFGSQRLTATATIQDAEPTARVRDETGKVTAISRLARPAPPNTVETRS